MTDPLTRQTVQVPTRLGRLAVTAVGSGPPVVLWHSMFVDSSSWSRMVPLLAPSRRLLMIDGPSSGGSQPLTRAADIGACAEAAAEVLAGLADETGGGPVDWVGSAWGGHVGLHLAASRPALIRSLAALSAPTMPIDPDLRRTVRALVPVYRLIGARGPVAAAVTESLLSDASRRDDHEAVELLLGPMRRADRRGMANAIRTAILNRTDLTWAARRVSCPTLFVTTDDRGEWTPEQAREAAAAMADATVVTISGSRVLIPVEQPDRLVELLLAFWGEARRRAPISRSGTSR